METIRTVAWMKEKARAARQEQRIIGLVPTMGALHAGHMALVERAYHECSPVYASIFLNPKQFAANEDLSRYPRPLEADITKLTSAKVGGLFLPDAAEIYPPGFSTYVQVEGVSERLEGKSRAGHFRGVSTVVMKLFEIVQPHYAYFGRKDAQQGTMIRRMVSDLNFPLEIIVAPTVREVDGLALSSRNAYLDPHARRIAPIISRTLDRIHHLYRNGERDSARTLAQGRAVLADEPAITVEYLEAVDPNQLAPVETLADDTIVATAVRLGKTRLIDNIVLGLGLEGDEILAPPASVPLA